ncbi:SufE family protein [Catenovulum sp. SM1970]|uniref:SufE family protein n=1 Tax=Marinifaba aquimaris TaxID=2741323 RepID=UPI0015731601|nr:SufE family protein [Marinifaba aquimaris]NTS78902.1 SufE family protein [Marinifaba aquimaris]
MNSQYHDIINTFEQFASWEDRYRFLMKAGKNLADFPDKYRTEQNLVQGCESQVWLHIEISNDELKCFADADARIVKGLLFILLTPLNGLNAKQIATFDLNGYFEQLALIKHLSPSRGNGLLSIANTIQQTAHKLSE